MTATIQLGGDANGERYQDSQAGRDVRDGPVVPLPAEFDQTTEPAVPTGERGRMVEHLSEADVAAIEEAAARAAIEAQEILAIRYAAWLAASEYAQWEVDATYAQQLVDAAARERAASARPVRVGSADAYCTTDFFRPYFGGAASAAAAVCRCESDFPSDTGAAGEKGLMQMMHFHQWRADLYGGNLYDPHVNAAAAAHLWREQGWSPWTCAKTLGIV